MKSETN